MSCLTQSEYALIIMDTLLTDVDEHLTALDISADMALEKRIVLYEQHRYKILVENVSTALDNISQSCG